jgi:hypothetical protein
VVTDVSEETISFVYLEYGDISHDKPQISSAATKRSFCITPLISESRLNSTNKVAVPLRAQTLW